jgi:hypothetical protein
VDTRKTGDFINFVFKLDQTKTGNTSNLSKLFEDHIRRSRTFLDW